MQKIQIDNIAFQHSTSPIIDTIPIDITFTALEALPSALTWKIIYVGSAFTEDYDQILEEF